ncbi:hypothetical protein [Pseudanabaena mucicola]|uniref:hypothetical protein n=1 Tax=Pseudanabaena mucicola TaxID=71190 RepID=UPI002575A6AA|nr:hypothetical protein [Pseudanabaena mucicola]
MAKPKKRVFINLAGEINIINDRAILNEKEPKLGLPTGKQYIINLESWISNIPQKYKDTHSLEIICTVKGWLDTEVDSFPKDYIYQISSIHYVIERDISITENGDSNKNYFTDFDHVNPIKDSNSNSKNTEKTKNIIKKDISNQTVFKYVGSKEEVERQITDYLQTIFGGMREVATPNGDRIDLLTKNLLIEVKAARDWDNAVGQILKYKIHYPDHKLIIFLFDDGFSCEDAKSRLLEICGKFINTKIHAISSIEELKIIHDQ